ncbi:hypothetical protein RHGRI_014801 [Rhododendron griersonianum]|uniref:Protein TIC 20 n=1 Tax=Rhododendron griersonianum TaxID=479676 RepID=A0AAV6KAV3_9ERIC|nr:hypothetical protein RHGRI_014801 [Rhododendron griersonianum]
MASSPLLRLSLLPLHPTNLSPHPLRSPFAPTPLPRTRSNLTHTTAATWPPRRTAKTTTCMSSYNNNSTTPATDRLVSAVAYVLPLIKGLSYGRFLYAKYPTLATSLEPILPLLNLYHSIPYASLVSFFALYLGVARNPRLSRYVSVVCCILGRTPYLPFVAEAADRQFSVNDSGRKSFPLVWIANWQEI